MAQSIVLFSLFCIVSSRRIIDLTHEVTPGLPQWPGQKKFTVASTSPPDAIWSSRSFCMEEHTGTHLDAPLHFNKMGHKVHEIPIDHLMGPLVVVDIRERTKENPNAMVLAKDLEDWEEQHGEIPSGSIVVMFSGWGSRWDNPVEYLGDVDNATNLKFPGFSSEAAKFLVARHVYGAGVDTPSLDPGNSTGFETHFVLSKNNVFGLENLANVEKLPVKGAIIYAMPMLLKDGTGAPARVFAVIEDTV